MKNILLKATTFLTGISLIASCGGSGSSVPTSGGSIGSSGGSNYSISLNSVSIQETTNDNIIQPGEVFYIKWNAVYSGADLYRVDFFSLPDNNVPNSTDSPSSQFAGVNCINSLVDCSKGLKCQYLKETDNYGNTNYYFSCSSYSTISGYEGWGTPTKKKIDPYSVNYIGADAMIYEYKLNGYAVDVVEHHSKKAIPINLGF